MRGQTLLHRGENVQGVQGVHKSHNHVTQVKTQQTGIRSHERPSDRHENKEGGLRHSLAHAVRSHTARTRAYILRKRHRTDKKATGALRHTHTRAAKHRGNAAKTRA